MNGRKRILTAGVLVAILVLVLVPLTHLLSKGQDAAQEQAPDSVEAMLNLLAQSQKYRADIAVEPMLELEDIWTIEDVREESEAPLVKGMRNGDQEMGYDAASDTFYCTIGMETGETWPELALFAQGADDAQNLHIVWVDDYGYDYASDAVREGWRYELLAYTDTEFAYFGVVFTGLPIVTLHVDGGAEALEARLEEYSALLEGSGALVRDLERWTENTAFPDTYEFITFAAMRWPLIDKAMELLVTTDGPVDFLSQTQYEGKAGDLFPAQGEHEE